MTVLTRFNLGLVLLLLILSQSVAFSASSDVGTTAMDFSKLSSSVKAESVGNAMTAGTELAAMTINPASLATLSRTEINMQQLGYIQDVSYQMVHTGLPTPFGNFGLEAGIIDLGKQSRTINTNDPSIGSEIGTFENRGYQLKLAYGVRSGDVDFGVGVKYISQTLDSNTATAMGVDAGVLYALNSSLSLGFAVNNISLTRPVYIADTAILPFLIRAGLQSKSQFLDRPVTLYADVVSPQDDEVYYGAGVDIALSDPLSFRAGYTTYGGIANLGMGLGFQFDTFSIDFAYKPTKDLGQSYRLGFGMKL